MDVKNKIALAFSIFALLFALAVIGRGQAPDRIQRAGAICITQSDGSIKCTARPTKNVELTTSGGGQVLCNGVPCSGPGSGSASGTGTVGTVPQVVNATGPVYGDSPLKVSGSNTRVTGKFCYDAAFTVCTIAGTGDPESAVTAGVGSVYYRTDGSSNATVYRKETGAGNTGWVATSNAFGIPSFPSSYTITSYINNFYQTAWVRAPSGGELAADTSSLNGQCVGTDGTRAFRVAAATYGQGFFTNVEYTARGRTDSQFIDDLYQAYLGRTADSVGHAFWQGQIATLGRNGVSRAFAYSMEYINNRLAPICYAALYVADAIAFAGKSIDQSVAPTNGQGWFYNSTTDQYELTSPAAAVTDATISTSDITTNNVSITKHGWAPKLPNDATKFLDGTGAYSVPPAGSIAPLVIEDANTIAQRNGATAQTFNLYGSYTSAGAVYNRLQFNFSGSNPRIETQSNGGGSGGNLIFKKGSALITWDGSTFVPSGASQNNGTSALPWNEVHGNELWPAAAGSVRFSGRGELYSPSDGVLQIKGSGGNSGNGLELIIGDTSVGGGVRLQRVVSTTALRLRVGDDSAFAYLVDNGRSFVSSQFDKTNTTLANVTGLTANVTAAKTYSFEASLFVDADATGGGKYAIAGTATATAIKYQVSMECDASNAFVINSRQTALAGSVGQAGCTAGVVKIVGTITVNAGGTLTVQFAQNAANGTSSVLTMSRFVVQQLN